MSKTEHPCFVNGICALSGLLGADSCNASLLSALRPLIGHAAPPETLDADYCFTHRCIVPMSTPFLVHTCAGSFLQSSREDAQANLVGL